MKFSARSVQPDSTDHATILIFKVGSFDLKEPAPELNGMLWLSPIIPIPKRTVNSLGLSFMRQVYHRRKMHLQKETTPF